MSKPDRMSAVAQPTVWSSSTPPNVTKKPTPVWAAMSSRRCSSDGAAAYGSAADLEPFGEFVLSVEAGW
ncbi:hypothetical protein FHS23_004226 [Prauserella isguenensis]|uniref:Uncharacterized protein n=1 Tax=Prauserella isguenensis TaxID=1470180 RepID=A0A839S7D4_9PSEU|nr:hypothetical protein [Prauserella isguenensis]